MPVTCGVAIEVPSHAAEVVRRQRQHDRPRPARGHRAAGPKTRRTSPGSSPAGPRSPAAPASHGSCRAGTRPVFPTAPTARALHGRGRELHRAGGVAGRDDAGHAHRLGLDQGALLDDLEGFAAAQAHVDDVDAVLDPVIERAETRSLNRAPGKMRQRHGSRPPARSRGRPQRPPRGLPPIMPADMSCRGRPRPLVQVSLGSLPTTSKPRPDLVQVGACGLHHPQIDDRDLDALAVEGRRHLVEPMARWPQPTAACRGSLR